MSNERRALDVSISVLSVIFLVCGCSTVDSDSDAQDFRLGNNPVVIKITSAKANEWMGFFTIHG